MSLEETAKTMASLAPAKGKSHPWWALGISVKFLYDNADKYAKVIEEMEREFDKRVAKE